MLASPSSITSTANSTLTPSRALFPDEAADRTPTAETSYKDRTVEDRESHPRRASVLYDHSQPRPSTRDSLESRRASFAGWTRTVDAYGHSVVVPRNSILLNPPKRKAYEALVFPAVLSPPLSATVKAPSPSSLTASPLLHPAGSASDSVFEDSPGAGSAGDTPTHPSEYPFDFPFRPAPVVTRIPEVVDKALEKEQREQRKQELEREKEREREREREKAKEEEKIWGIPKKAFLGGLGGVGEVNFNAQIAMLGGWGNGSGGGSWSTPAPATHQRPRSRSGRVSGEVETAARKRNSMRLSPGDRDRQREHDKREREKAEREREEKEKAEAEAAAAAAAEESEPMDPEELAALNAIINTRRSMAAAQALASGQVRPGGGVGGTALAGQKEIVPCNLCAAAAASRDEDGDISMAESSTQTAKSRPSLEQSGDIAKSTAAPISSLASRTSDTLSVDVTSANASVADEKGGDASADETCSSCQQGCTCPLRPHTCRALSVDMLSPASGASSAGVFPWSAGGSKIRFAPLPGSAEEASEERGRAVGVTGSGSRHSSPDRTESIMDSEEDHEEGEGEGWRRWYAPSKDYKGKWYLMGLPTSVFTPTRSKHRTSVRSGGDDETTADEDEGSHSEHNSEMGSANGHAPSSESVEDGSANGEANKRVRRLSTGTIGVVAAIEADRKGTTQAESLSSHGLIRSTATLEAEGTQISRRSRGRKPARPATATGVLSSAKRARSTSRSRLSFSGSKSETEDLLNDDEMRARRSRLIRAARPGGTGMVTLPDGTKIPARKVDDASMGRSSGGALMRRMSDTEPDADFAEWGFAGLVRAQKEAQAQAEEEARMTEETETYKSFSSVPAANVEAKPQKESEGVHVKSDDTVLASSSGATPVTSSTSTSKPASPPTTNGKRSGLGLSVQQAEEVFRRHELEVEALGAEVRASMAAAAANARAAVAAKASAGASSDTASVPTVNVQAASKASEENGSAHNVKQDDGAAAAGESSKPGSGANSASSTLKVPSSGKKAGGQEDTDRSFLARLGLRSRSSEARRQRQGSSSSTISGLTKITSIDSSSTSPPSPSSITASLNNSSATPSSPRISSNKKVSIPAPSPSLPRRPDARGHVVVPLPQLGVRPERPVEGRVWRWDSEDDGTESDVADTDDDEDEDAEIVDAAGEGEKGRSTPGFVDGERKGKSSKELKGDVENRTDATLNAEEEAEEQRRTERQKARATTMAAGQEVVRAGTGAGKSSIGSGGDLARSKTRTVELKGGNTSQQRKAGKMAEGSATGRDSETRSPPADSERGAPSGTATPSSASQLGTSTPPRLRSAVSSPALAHSPRRRDRSKNPSSSTAASRSLSGTRLKSSKSAHHFGLADLDDLDPDDPLSLADAELWPVTLAGSLSLGGGGTRGSVPALSRKAAQAQVAALAARAKMARDRRTEKEKEREKEEEQKRLKRLQDPEQMDYGWPKSHVDSIH